MPLGSIAAYEEWVARFDPGQGARLAVAEFILRTAERPWATPSVPVESLCERPVYEVRCAELAVPGDRLTVFYRHVFASGVVDVIGIIG